MKIRKFMILPVVLLAMVLGLVSVSSKIGAEDKILTKETRVVYVDSDKSDEELLKEMERIENEKVQAQANRTRSSVGYTVKLEFYRNEYKSTGLKVAGNQPAGGTNFGSGGGAFGYTDGTAHGAVSMSFGVSGYHLSASIGVGTRQKAGVNGYSIRAPKNKFVKLYVNKTVRAVTYKRYKIHNSNGYKEAYGYTTAWPTTYSLSFSVK